MMKKDSIHYFGMFKVFQLVLNIIFVLVFFVYLKSDPVLNSNVFTNTKLLTVCVFLWAYMIVSFAILAVDFRHLEKTVLHEEELKRIAYRDSLTGIPNRLSCDIQFQKYEGMTNTKGMAAILISITNLEVINEAIGRERGNYLIQDFATVFQSVGIKYGFAGRNGGNEFLIVMEKCTPDRVEEFLTELSTAVKRYNDESEHMPVMYKSTSVLSDEYSNPTFTDLIIQLYKSRGQVLDG